MSLINKIKKSREIPVKVVERNQPIILQAECNKETITIFLSDSRIITIPTDWYKVLREATAKQLKNIKIMPAKEVFTDQIWKSF